MNGMVVDSWPYVIVAYSVTWVVLFGYVVHLVRTDRRIRDARNQLQKKS
jgi:CcmD family protein